MAGQVGANTYLASPTDCGLYLVSVGVDHARTGDREAQFANTLAAWPEVAETIRGGTRVGPLRTMGRWHGYLRRSAGPGWALVGDAGHFKDPTPGQGIADALRQGERLTDAILRSLGAASNPDQPLLDWWRWRDRDAWAMYWLAADMGAGGATPPLLDAVMARLVGRPRRVEQLFRAFDHDVAPGRALGPGLLLGGLADALRANDGHRTAVLGEARHLLSRELARWSAGRRLPSSRAHPVPVRSAIDGALV